MINKNQTLSDIFKPPKLFCDTLDIIEKALEEGGFRLHGGGKTLRLFSYRNQTYSLFISGFIRKKKNGKYYMDDWHIFFRES